MKQKDRERKKKMYMKRVKTILENPEEFNPEEAAKLYEELENWEKKNGKFDA